MPAPERLGLFGGTFDPPHRGHLAAAAAARESLGLDRILFVVANEPWQKSRRITPAVDRLAMVEALLDGEPHFEPCRLEIDRGGPSYTVDTVEELRRQSLEAGTTAPQITVIIGSDLLATLPTWHRPLELAAAVDVAVVARPDSPKEEPPPGWQAVWVEGRPVDASSSEIRHRLSDGTSVEAVLPESVIHCIRSRSLYAGGR